jgi:cytochrome d ubiquinol oxidase subunit I
VFTLAGFVLFYSLLLVVDIILMAKYIRMGPARALDLEAPALRKSMMPAE